MSSTLVSTTSVVFPDQMQGSSSQNQVQPNEALPQSASTAPFDARKPLPFAFPDRCHRKPNFGEEALARRSRARAAAWRSESPIPTPRFGYRLTLNFEARLLEPQAGAQRSAQPGWPVMKSLAAKLDSIVKINHTQTFLEGLNINNVGGSRSGPHDLNLRALCLGLQPAP